MLYPVKNVVLYQEFCLYMCLESHYKTFDLKQLTIVQGGSGYYNAACMPGGVVFLSKIFYIVPLGIHGTIWWVSVEKIVNL